MVVLRTLVVGAVVAGLLVAGLAGKVVTAETT